MAVSVINLASRLDRGFIDVKWLIQCGVVVPLVAGIRLGLLLDFASLFAELLGCLQLLELMGWDLLYLCWELLLLLGFLLGVVGCTVLQWLQHYPASIGIRCHLFCVVGPVRMVL